MTLLEMQMYGNEYASQVVANTKALAEELYKRHFKLLCPELGYSTTHELIVDLEGSSGAEATKQLDGAGIFVNPQELPNDLVGAATGLRLGTQVLTRRGFKERDMAAVAEAMSDVLKKRKFPKSVSRNVADKCSGFQGVSYTFAEE
jgi:glycine hydroxymethyltransferase